LRLADPDFARRDFREAIDTGNFPSWNFRIQVTPEKDAEKYHIKILDVTQVWPHGGYPLIPVGRLVLDRNPDSLPKLSKLDFRRKSAFWCRVSIRQNVASQTLQLQRYSAPSIWRKL